MSDIVKRPAPTSYDKIRDLEVMVMADVKDLVKMLEAGNRVAAHELVDSIIDNRRQIEDLV